MEYSQQTGMTQAEIISRRRTTVMWSQSNLQPLQQNIQPGFQQNIFIQPSRQFMNLAHQKLYFRPVVQMAQDSLPDLARKQMLGISFISADSIWTIQSVCINGNQLLSQSQSQLQRTRSIFQAYYNSMSAKKKKNKLTGTNTVYGQAMGSGNGSALQGITKLIPTHPYSQTPIATANLSKFEGFEQTVNPTTGATTATTSFFPRAIIDRSKIVNADFMFPVWGSAGNTSGQGNNYMANQISANSDSQPNNGAMNYPGNYPNQGTQPLPCLVNSTTPSVNIYLKQQSKFQDMRVRFLTQVVTSFCAPFSTGFSTTVALVNGVTGASPAQIVMAEQQEQFVQSVQAGGVSLTCSSVANAQITSNIGGSTARQIATGGQVILNALSSTSGYYYAPPELYTQLEVSLGELSMELDQLGEICLENSQIQIQLQANLPQNVLSAFLQPSLIALGATAGNAGTGATTAQCKGFLDACVLGSATYQITDLIMRLEYIDYPAETYEQVKKLHMIPKPYMSLRQQLDPLPIEMNSTFSQRVAINNPIVLAFVCFIVPTNNNKPTYLAQSGQQSSPLPQDTIVNYLGCNPLTDLRGCYLDSYAMNLTSYYIDDGSGRRFESNDVNIANGQYSTYLRTMDGLQTAFHRYLDIDFQEWVQNRAIICIPFNVNADPELALTSSQVVLSLTFENSNRVESSTLYNECNKTLSNQFSLLTFCVTAQSLVDCSFVRIG